MGAFSGAVFGAVGGYFGDTWKLSRVAASAVAGGTVAQVSGGKFTDGEFLSAVTAGARYLYNKAVGYGATFKGGTKQGTYAETMPISKDQAAVGFNRNKTGKWTDMFNQGEPLSRVANRLTINSVAKLHDAMQIAIGEVSSGLRRYTMVPTMAPAAIINYTALMDGIPAHTLSRLERNQEVRNLKHLDLHTVTSFFFTGYHKLQIILMLLCMVTLTGCTYPVDVFRPESSLTSDHEQGNVLYIHREELDLNLSSYYTKESFYVYIYYYESSYADYTNRQIQIDTTKIKITDDTGRKYLPVSIYEVDDFPFWFSTEGGTNIDGTTDFTLKNTFTIRMEFPLSILELNSFQMHTGVLGDITLKVFTVKQVRGFGISGGVTEGDV